MKVGDVVLDLEIPLNALVKPVDDQLCVFVSECVPIYGGNLHDGATIFWQVSQGIDGLGQERKVDAATVNTIEILSNPVTIWKEGFFLMEFPLFCWRTAPVASRILWDILLGEQAQDASSGRVHFVAGRAGIPVILS